ncbi:hypothetical protein ABPG74_022474 [Tetrahymena malaccensis]
MQCQYQELKCKLKQVIQIFESNNYLILQQYSMILMTDKKYGLQKKLPLADYSVHNYFQNIIALAGLPTHLTLSHINFNFCVHIIIDIGDQIAKLHNPKKKILDEYISLNFSPVNMF